MINILISGMDIYFAGELDKLVHKKVASIYRISEDDLLLTANDSFVYHNGVEQTSFQLLIKVEAPQEFKKHQEEIQEYLLEATKQYAVHSTIYFVYYDGENCYKRIDPEYPLFLTENNVVEIDEDVDEEIEELYEGDIFEEVAKAHLDEEDEGDHHCNCGHHHHHHHHHEGEECCGDECECEKKN